MKKRKATCFSDKENAGDNDLDGRSRRFNSAKRKSTLDEILSGTFLDSVSPQNGETKVGNDIEQLSPDHDHSDSNIVSTDQPQPENKNSKRASIITINATGKTVVKVKNRKSVRASKVVVDVRLNS